MDAFIDEAISYSAVWSALFLPSSVAAFGFLWLPIQL